MSIPAFYSGTGRRKTAIARVRLLPGEGEIVVNGRTLEEHFGNAVNESEVRMPFRVTGTEGRFNVMIKVEGGGVTGQAGAIRHGIARALLELDPEANRLPLRQAGSADTRSPNEGDARSTGSSEPEKPRSTRSVSHRRAAGTSMRALPDCARSLTQLGLRSLPRLPAPSPGRPSRAQRMTASPRCAE